MPASDRNCRFCVSDHRHIPHEEVPAPKLGSRPHRSRRNLDSEGSLALYVDSSGGGEQYLGQTNGHRCSYIHRLPGGGLLRRSEAVARLEVQDRVNVAGDREAKVPGADPVPAIAVLEHDSESEAATLVATHVCSEPQVEEATGGTDLARPGGGGLGRRYRCVPQRKGEATALRRRGPGGFAKRR